MAFAPLDKVSFSDFDNGALLSLDLRSYLKEIRRIENVATAGSVKNFGAVMRRYLGVQTNAILTLSREIDDFTELRVALRPYFSHWQNTYILLIKYFQDQGYSFKTMDEFSEDDIQKKVAFLRYDIHCRDLPGLYGYLDVNSALGLPSNAYVFWRYANQEASYSDHFRMLNKFAEAANCKIGYHASPVDSYLIWSRFGGAERDEVAWLRSSDGKDFIPKLIRDQGFLKNLVGEATKHFLAGVRDFQGNFDNTVGIASHGGALGYFLRNDHGVLPAQIGKREDKADVDRVWSAVSARGFMSTAPIAKTGLGYDSDMMPYHHGFEPISDSVRNVDDFLVMCERAFSKQHAAEILCHPATLANNLGHGDLFSALCAKMNISEDCPVYRQGARFEESQEQQPVANAGMQIYSIDGTELPNGADFQFGVGEELGTISVKTGGGLINRNWSVRGVRSSCKFKPGTAYRFTFNSVENTGKMFFKPWVFFFDENGLPLKQMARNPLEIDTEMYLEMCSNQLAAYFEILIEFGGKGTLTLQNSVSIEEVDFPYLQKP